MTPSEERTTTTTAPPAPVTTEVENTVATTVPPTTTAPTTTTAAPQPTTTTAAPRPTTTTTQPEPPPPAPQVEAGIWCDESGSRAHYRGWFRINSGQVDYWETNGIRLDPRDFSSPGEDAVSVTFTAFGPGGQVSITASGSGDCGKDAADLPDDDPVEQPETTQPPAPTPDPPVTLPPQNGTPGGGEPDPADPNPLPPGGNEGTENPGEEPDDPNVPAGTVPPGPIVGIQLMDQVCTVTPIDWLVTNQKTAVSLIRKTGEN